MIWLSAIILSIGSAVLYRMGGSGNYDTKVRDLGLPSCMIIFLITTINFHWWAILAFFLMFAAQTTYFKKKGENAKWWNWMFVGIAFGVCMLPYSIAIGNLNGFFIRLGVVTLFTTLWSERVDWDIAEEAGRGWIQIITLPLLLV